jgi:glycosyltransferase involved in cell wall biosynthesis
MPRVLLTGFCAVPGPRRAGVQLRHVIRSLTSLHSVDLLVVREGEQAYVERQGSVRVLRVPTHESDLRSQIQAFQRALKRQLDGADYDVVHCRDSWSAVPVLDARSRLRYAVVYDLTRSPLGETTFDSELDAQYAREEEACLLAADMVLAPTPAAVKALQSRGKPERVVLSPPGVDVDRFDWEQPGKGTIPRILYTGSIDPGRGVRVLVRAMAAIVREVDARLVLAGSMAPKFDQALRDGIRELNLTDKIEVLSPVDHDQMPALIATATVCVVPAAADLTPNPTVVYPTKILEYMACRRPIVAPRRETVAQVVENNREALLFEPGDPVDLARKVLRLLGEPLLRDRLAQNAYERVRRDFTASAARRSLRSAYTLLSERFELEAEDPSDDVPKADLLADDDFEATVFEEAPAPPPVDTALNKLEALDDALVMLEVESEATGSTSSESVIAPPPPPGLRADETMGAPAAPPRRDSEWTVSAIAVPPAPPGQDDWAITGLAGMRGLDLGDDGTPIEGVAPAPAPGMAMGGTFVAGEIDVPAPPPERGRDTAKVELRNSLLGADPGPDPDTGSRTPPIERR